MHIISEIVLFCMFLQEYGKYGIRLWGLTVQNEPMNGEVPLFPFQCMGYTAEIMRDFVKLDLGPALRSNGYGSLKLMILDDQRFEVTHWTQTVSQRWLLTFRVSWRHCNANQSFMTRVGRYRCQVLVGVIC